MFSEWLRFTSETSDSSMPPLRLEGRFLLSLFGDLGEAPGGNGCERRVVKLFA